MSLIKKYLKRFVFSIIVVYSLNCVLMKYDFFLPINYVSSVIYSFLGVPGILVYVFLMIKYR